MSRVVGRVGREDRSRKDDEGEEDDEDEEEGEGDDGDKKVGSCKRKASESSSDSEVRLGPLYFVLRAWLIM